jgi:hypothetical protein
MGWVGGEKAQSVRGPSDLAEEMSIFLKSKKNQEVATEFCPSLSQSCPLTLKNAWLVQSDTI